MYRTDFASPSPLRNHLNYPQEAPSTERSTRDKVKSLFLSAQKQLATIENWLSTRSNSVREKFFGQTLVTSENRGKFSDTAKYARFARLPVELADSGKKIVRETTGEELTWSQAHLSPEIIDKGKCVGASTLFIGDYLEKGENVEEWVGRYKDGVPVKGVLLQEIYKNTSQSFSSTELEFERALDQTLRGEVFEREGLDSDDLAFVEQVQTYLSKGLTLSAFKDTHPNLDKGRLETLERVRRTPNLNSREQAIARLNGTEIDWSTGSRSAQEILNTVTNLPPGAYQLSFPTTGSHGHRAGHATALIIGQDRMATFYDPNYGVGYTSKSTETVENVFKHYTGYKPEGLNRIDRIKNSVLNRPPPPEVGFSLSHYRKVEQLPS